MRNLSPAGCLDHFDTPIIFFTIFVSIFLLQLNKDSSGMYMPSLEQFSFSPVNVIVANGVPE